MPVKYAPRHFPPPAWVTPNAPRFAPVPNVTKPVALQLRPAVPSGVRFAPAPVPAPPKPFSFPKAPVIQRMQTGGEVTESMDLGVTDSSGNMFPTHHLNTLESVVGVYRHAESGHTNWDTQKSMSSHRNRCGAAVVVLGEDQFNGQKVFSRDIVFDGCINLYSSGTGKETKAQVRPQINELTALNGGVRSPLDSTMKRKEFSGPQLTKLTQDFHGYDVTVNVASDLDIKSNYMALTNQNMNYNIGGRVTKYTASSHRHSEQVIVVALQGTDQEVAQWLKTLRNTNPNLTWVDYTIQVHSEREMCNNCSKAFNYFIQHPVMNYKETWKQIKQHFTYLPTFQVSARVPFNQNKAQRVGPGSLHGGQTFTGTPTLNPLSSLTPPSKMQLDDIYDK